MMQTRTRARVEFLKKRKLDRRQAWLMGYTLEGYYEIVDPERKGKTLYLTRAGIYAPVEPE